MLYKLEEIFKNNASRIAYIVNDDRITYKQLWEKSSYIADLLKRQGTGPVIIYGHKSVDMIVSIIACLISKRTYIPIDICTPTYRIQKIVDMSGASLIIKNEQLEHVKNIDILTLKELNIYSSYGQKKICNDIAYIIFTSGSAGDPKGVPISYRNLENFIKWINSIEPLSSYLNIKVLNQASFSFDLSVADIYYSISNGHTLVSLDKYTQDSYNDIFNVIRNSEINVIVATPTFLKLCILNSDFNTLNYPFLDCLYLCGEILEKSFVKKIFEKFPNIKIINAYGPTEATSAVCGILIEKDMLLTESILPVGTLSNTATDIFIIDDEIILKGESVFNGYINNYTGGYYKENGINFYKTGDNGYIANGKIYCKGRKDNQIKYKGYRIELNDIEENIKKIDGVKECVVIAKYDCNCCVKIIKAFVVLEEGIEEAYVKNELKKLLPAYMIPKSIIKIDEMPINNNYKIDRKQLSNL